MEERYGFIGTGNMGGAVARAVCRAVGGEKVLLCNRTPEKARCLAQELACGTADNETAAASCRYLFLGVKPQGMAPLLTALRPILQQHRPVLVSMAAGVTLRHIQEQIGESCPVIRIMPNTPVAVGEGMILFCTAPTVSERQTEVLLDALADAGRLDRLEEKLIDAGSAVAGCGPAFAFLFVEALADGGVACGLPREKALAYAAQTVLGAAKTVRETKTHPGALKDAVCSPGGTTIEGVRALEEGAFRASAMNAVCAAYEKTRKMAK